MGNCVVIGLSLGFNFKILLFGVGVILHFGGLDDYLCGVVVG